MVVKIASKSAKRKRQKKEPAQATLHQVADRRAPSFSTNIVSSVDQFKKVLPVKNMEELIAAGAYDALQFAIPWDNLNALVAAGVGEDIVRSLREASDKTADTTARALRAASGIKPVLSFDEGNPAVRRYVETRTANLVQDISKDGKNAIRQVILDSRLKELGPREIISRIKGVIGLREDQARALRNYQDGLAEKGVPKSRINQLAKQREARMMGQRADMIARTESITAANTGHQIGWEQAAGKGMFNPDEAEVMWVTAQDGDRVCNTCRPMDGVTRGFNETWSVEIRSGGKGGGHVIDTMDVKVPNVVHPNCRCTAKLII